MGMKSAKIIGMKCPKIQEWSLQRYKNKDNKIMGMKFAKCQERTANIGITYVYKVAEMKFGNLIGIMFSKL